MKIRPPREPRDTREPLPPEDVAEIERFREFLHRTGGPKDERGPRVREMCREDPSWLAYLGITPEEAREAWGEDWERAAPDSEDPHEQT